LLSCTHEPWVPKNPRVRRETHVWTADAYGCYTGCFDSSVFVIRECTANARGSSTTTYESYTINPPSQYCIAPAWPRPISFVLSARKLARLYDYDPMVISMIWRFLRIIIKWVYLEFFINGITSRQALLRNLYNIYRMRVCVRMTYVCIDIVSGLDL